MKSGLTLLLMLVTLTACAGVPTVSLEQLANEQEQFTGETVRTSGVVRQFAEADGTAYYVLEDSDANRIQLLPSENAARYAGQQLTVVGRFELKPTLGRVLHVESVTADDG